MSAPREMRPFEINSAQGDLEKTFGAFGRVVMPNESQPPILTPPVRGALQQWMLEMNAAAELEAVGVKPRKRCMLYGPPGTGKTTLAHHVAARFRQPMLVIACHEIASMYIGKSGQNIGALFKAARADRHNIGLFFDEFDALAKNRDQLGGGGAGAEMSNITVALLQEFDRFNGLLFAATNQNKRIDGALWRRFEMQIEIGYPGEDERFAIVKLYMAPYAVDEDTIWAIAEAMAGASPALIKQCCEFIKRSMVLARRTSLSDKLQDIMARFAASNSAPDGQDPPRLWQNSELILEGLSTVPWPPVLNTGG